ncbi:MAG: S8 family peptidase [Muribaculaceae bacterium]|nr:S8 family peptidase [Muribaculaceae bacterium]
MKPLKLLTLSLVVPAALSAQNKIDMAGLQMLNDYQAQHSQGGSRAMVHEPIVVSKNVIPSVVMAMVTVDSPEGINALQRRGVNVISERAGVALVEMPMDKAQSIAELPQVRSISFGTEAEPTLNYARRDSYVVPIHNGTDGLPRAYTGAGVVTGLQDTGLDPNHINFTGRVSRVWVINPGSGTSTSVITYDTPTKIAGFTTENSAKTHGTHVLGIMSGAYNGAGRYGTYNTSGSYMLGTKNIPYYGVATGADIVVGCGSLADACVLRSGELLTEYAKAQGKPAVFNLSLGTNIGPHDGTEPFSRYLADLGKDAVICISAGNEGGDRMSFEQTFSSSTLEFCTFLGSTSGNQRLGAADFWSADSKTFSVTFAIYDTQESKITYSYELNRNTEGAEVAIANPNYSGNNINSTDFDEAMSGYVILRSNVATYNNRYQVYVYTNLTPTSSRYVPGLIVSGPDGVKVSGFCSSALNFTGRGISGWHDGSAVNSANGMACGENVLVIGAYCTRDRIPLLSGTGTGSTPVGSISTFSSYGVEPNGRSIPDLCAPGQFVISSVSTPYINAIGFSATSLSAQTPYPAATGSTRNNYWQEMSGTSMASPFAAGVCALLLEADPTLKVNDIRNILTTTAIRDKQVTSATNQVQWGAGKLDALSAMKKVLKIDAAIGHLRTDDAERLIVTRSGSTINVLLAGENHLTVSLYSTTGALAARAEANSDEAVLSTDGLTSGIYILVAEGSTGRTSQKIVL